MKSVIKIALIVAVPIEGISWLFPFPVDVGYTPDVPWYINLAGGFWLILHLPGLRVVEWFRCDGNMVFPFLLVSGYFVAALLLFGLISGFQALGRLARRFRTA